MMPPINRKFHFTKSVVAKATPSTKPYDIRDSEIMGLLLRIYPSGTKTFFLTYLPKSGRRNYIKIGRADHISPPQARDLAKQILGEVAKGEDPRKSRMKTGSEKPLRS